MYSSSSGRSILSSSSRSKESSSSGFRSSRFGASTSGPTRGRSPRRSRSPSPRGRSPSPRLTSRVDSPSGGSLSRRGSGQRDGSLSQRCSPRRHSCSSRRHSQFLGSCSPSQHSESSVEQNLWTEFNSDFYGIDPRDRRRLSDRLSDVDRGYLDDDSVFIRGLSHSRSPEQYRSRQESPPSSFSTRYHKDYRGRDAFLHQSDYNTNDDYLEDLPRESDRDGKLFTKSLYPSEEERINPKRLRYDREDRLLDVSTDPRGSLSENRNYYKRRLSSSQMYPDEDPVSSRRNREEEELSKNTCQDYPGSDYVICGLSNSLQSSESQYLYRPDEAPGMPKKSILKKRVDDPTVQPSEPNFGSFLRKKYQELTSESADLCERASQDGSGISHILDRMVDSTSTQEKRRHNFLDVEDEEKFLYGDDEDESNINCPSTEMLTVNGGKESVSLNKRSPSPISSVKPDSSEGSGIEYEKIHDLLKTIGLDIGVVEIGKGAARTQERLHGKKILRSVDGPSYKADSSEKDSIQSNTHSSESPCGSFQPSSDVFSALISKHAKTLEYDNSAGPPEQSFPSVSVTPSAPPFLPNLPPPPPPVPQYSLSHFTAFLAAQALRNYPPPTMPPPSYNAYGHGMAYAASAWPMYPPPQQTNPTLPDVRRLASMTVPPQPKKSNLRVIETVSTIKENPENKRNKSVLVAVPITPTGSRLLSQSSNSGTTERISDGRNPAFEKPQGSKLGKRTLTDEECNKGHGVTAQSGNNSNETPHGALVLSNLHCKPSQESSPVSKQKSKKTQDTMTEAHGMKENVMDKTEKLKAEQEAQQKRLQYLTTELDRVSRQQRQMEQYKRIVDCKDALLREDVLLREVSQARENIVKEITQLQVKIEPMEKKQSDHDKNCLSKNPFYEERSILDQQAGLTPIQETEAKDEGSTKVERKEESKITKELGEEGDENEISKESKEKEGSHGQKLMIKLVLKKDNIQVEKKEGEIEESQKESSQSSSETCSLRKTETDNQSQDQDLIAPKAENAEEGKCRENKSQSGNTDSKQKVTVMKTQNLGMRTKKQKTARVAKVQQHFKSFDSPHCRPLFTLPSGPPLSVFPHPGSGISYNMYIPPFSNDLLFTLHKATEERQQNMKWYKR